MTFIYSVALKPNLHCILMGVVSSKPSDVFLCLWSSLLTVALLASVEVEARLSKVISDAASGGFVSATGDLHPGKCAA